MQKCNVVLAALDTVQTAARNAQQAAATALATYENSITKWQAKKQAMADAAKTASNLQDKVVGRPAAAQAAAPAPAEEQAAE
jgi:hypothetical protein